MLNVGTGLTIANASQVNLSPTEGPTTLTMTNLTVTGILQGGWHSGLAGTMDITTGTLHWHTASIVGEDSTLTVNGAATIGAVSAETNSSLGTTLIANGTTTWVGGYLYFYDGGSSTTEAGGTASFTVRLNSAPTADVIILIRSLNLAEGTVSVTQLIFTPLNWNLAQTVIVTGVDDPVRDGDKAYQIELTTTSTDPVYTGLDPIFVDVLNKDNEKGRIN